MTNHRRPLPCLVCWDGHWSHSRRGDALRCSLRYALPSFPSADAALQLDALLVSYFFQNTMTSKKPEPLCASPLTAEAIMLPFFEPFVSSLALSILGSVQLVSLTLLIYILTGNLPRHLSVHYRSRSGSLLPSRHSSCHPKLRSFTSSSHLVLIFSQRLAYSRSTPEIHLDRFSGLRSRVPGGLLRACNLARPQGLGFVPVRLSFPLIAQLNLYLNT
jgi:hypothetical protein